MLQVDNRFIAEKLYSTELLKALTCLTLYECMYNNCPWKTKDVQLLRFSNTFQSGREKQYEKQTPKNLMYVNAFQDSDVNTQNLYAESFYVEVKTVTLKDIA